MQEDSILNTIKTMLGFDLECSEFDLEILAAINSEIMVLGQLGLDGGVVVRSENETWSELLQGFDDLESAKAAIWLKTRLMVDPPSNSFLVTSFQTTLDEYEWRIREQIERRKSREKDRSWKDVCRESSKE